MLIDTNTIDDNFETGTEQVAQNNERKSGAGNNEESKLK